nr:endosomal/prevacuolar sodium/hydrogen exchanger [Quercus suber]
MAQLSENFIFIYLGLSLFTGNGLEFKPLFILVTIIGICLARWCAVFPLSIAINWFIRYRARRRGQEVAEEIPSNWKVMIFWAGLRGAVGVALAAGLTGTDALALRATVLVVVVLTVIIFGGTTSRMLEICHIRIGVVEEIDSDDEFDIEPVPRAVGAYARKNGSAFGHNSTPGNGNINLGNVDHQTGANTWSTGRVNGSPVESNPDLGRRNSSRARRDAQHAAEQGLLVQDNDFTDVHSDDEELDLPPAARRNTQNSESDANNTYPVSGARPDSNALTARGAISQILNATSEDAGTLFNRLDENFFKPHLLLDPSGSNKGPTYPGGNGGQDS